LTSLAIQSQANGVPKRRNMWSHVSHQPPMSKNSGDTGFGMCRSSWIQKSSFSPSSHCTGNLSVPKFVPRISSCWVTAMLNLSLALVVRLFQP
jgi:hypothetical protein